MFCCFEDVIQVVPFLISLCCLLPFSLFSLTYIAPSSELLFSLFSHFFCISLFVLSVDLSLSLLFSVFGFFSLFFLFFQYFTSLVFISFLFNFVSISSSKSFYFFIFYSKTLLSSISRNHFKSSPKN